MIPLGLCHVVHSKCRGQFTTTYQNSKPQQAELVPICKDALKVTSEKLKIPNPPDDRELRGLQVSMNPRLRNPLLTVSLTDGEDKYNTERVFSPSAEQIKRTGKVVEQIVKGRGLTDCGVRVELWKNTAFRDGRLQPTRPRSIQASPIEPGAPISRITLALSPRAEAALTKSGMKTTHAALKPFVHGLLGIMEELGQLPRGKQVKGLKLDRPDVEYADTDFDLQLHSKGLLTRVPRERLADVVYAFLAAFNKERGLSGTVWVKHGKPAVQRVSRV